MVQNLEPSLLHKHEVSHPSLVFPLHPLVNGNVTVTSSIIRNVSFLLLHEENDGETLILSRVTQLHIA